MDKRKRRNYRNNKNRILALFFSVLILGMLLLSGPANAFILDLKFNNNVKKGEHVVFTASVDIASGEILPVDKIILVIGDKSCVFDASGTIISGCSGMGISSIEKTLTAFDFGNRYGHYSGYGYNFGYGYGYSYGKLEYEITLNTQDYEGAYNVKLKADINGNLFEGEEKTLTVSLENVSYSASGGCLTSWICEEWSECIGEEQTRTCKKDPAYCYAPLKDKPEEKRYCETETSNTENTNPQENLGTENSETQESKMPLGITGGVIGAIEGTTGIIIIAFLAGITGAAITVRIIRKRRKINF